MKKILLIILLTTSILSSIAQELKVLSFRHLPEDMSARIVEPKLDFNGKKAAIIKIVTSHSDFSFDGGMVGIVGSIPKVGEIWLYVPQDIKRISIFHPELGILRNYYFPETILEASVYELILDTPPIKKPPKEELPQHGTLSIKSNYWGCDVYINGKYKGVTPCTIDELPTGTHRVELRKENYHTYRSTAEINAESTTELYGRVSLIAENFEYIPPKPDRLLCVGVGIDGLVGSLMGYSVPLELRFGKRQSMVKYSIGVNYSHSSLFGSDTSRDIAISQLSPSASVWFYFGNRERLALILGESVTMNFNRLNSFKIDNQTICSKNIYQEAYSANSIMNNSNFSNTISFGFGGYKWSLLTYVRFDITKTFDGEAIQWYDEIDSIDTDLIYHQINSIFFIGISFKWYI